VGKTGEFGAVHFFAVVFIEPALNAGHLGRTRGHIDVDFPGGFLYLIANQNAPWEKTQRFDKTFKTVFLNLKAC
jgi:hypothetical protein